jgi:fructose-1,6-bisphosphatase/inositol monophosphatase family enzyme
MVNNIISEIPLDTRQSYLETAVNLTRDSRSIIKNFISSGFSVSNKPDKSVVTEADTSVEKALREKLISCFPDHGIIGEEFPAYKPDSDYQWILDPIDGTDQFVLGIPVFGTIISLYFKDQPLIGVIDHPALNISVSGAAGLGVRLNGIPVEPGSAFSESTTRRRITTAKRENFLRWQGNGSIFDSIAARFPNLWVYDNCFSHTCVMSGSADAMIEYNVKIWDISASQVLVEELGGKYCCVDKQKRPNGIVTYSAVFGCPALVDEICDIVSSVKG